MTMSIQPSVSEEASYLTQWLSDPAILRWFPMIDEREIEDAVRIWIGYSRLKACFTACWEGVPVGMATLYLHPYQKFAHQCLFAIIVDGKHRNKGIGKALLEHLCLAGKENFNLELLHLEVYQGNPAIRLYERIGFQEYGRHPRFIKFEGEYADKIMMQKYLIKKD